MSAAMHDLPTAPDQLRAGIAAPERPVAVFIPGLGLDARSWEAVRHLLRGQSTVVLLPSMGHRAARRPDLRVERQAQRLLDAVPPGDRRPRGIGRSAAGQRALGRGPMRARKATTTSSSSTGPGPRSGSLRQVRFVLDGLLRSAAAPRRGPARPRVAQAPGAAARGSHGPGADGP